MTITIDNALPLFAAEAIDCAGLIPLDVCRIMKPYLLERAGLSAGGGSVLIFALPYRTDDEAEANLSAYAISLDYHRIAADLFSRLIPAFEARFPGARFAGFTDHSPIDERHAAALAGLGCLGDNGLIITPRYGSYVFLAELITDLPTDALPCSPGECLHCGVCRTACPVSFDVERCLSALTQKKGDLTEEEAELIRVGGSVWGCDICQSVCPMNRGASRTPHPAFTSDRLARLTAEQIEAMGDDAFAQRAYAWRGRAVILRNLRLFD